jgi:anaerobic selenocysteine-containing dehydrogenase
VARTIHRVCTLCEATCGLSFDVEGERILQVRPDHDDPFSRGFACPKGIAIAKVHDDPDRLRQPMRRTAGGSFEPISWDDALDLAATRLAEVKQRHGRNAVAIYWGNPIIHNHGALMLRTALTRALGTRNTFGAGSQDVSARFATSYYLYGSSLVVPIPDIDRTQYFLCVGANPVVSNGSVMTAPNVRARLRALRARGGKVVVVDPRRSETAREADEHVPIRPGGDAALLLAMAAVIVRERAPGAELLADVTGWVDVERRLVELDLEACARASGVPLPTIVRLARELAAAPSGVAYSRIGVCNNRFGTLATYATDLLNVVAGRLGREGGAMFTTPAIDAVRIMRLTGGDGHARWRSRVRGLPETMGEVPSAVLADEIETAGEGQIRALLTFAGNPVLSVPNGRRLDRALERLDFMVSIDIYVNETTRHADLILPPAWALAEEHFDLLFPVVSVRNVVRRSPAVVEKRPDELHDWEILLALTRRLGGGPTGMPALDRVLNLAERVGLRWTPLPTLSFLLRTGAWGDGFLPWKEGLDMRALDRAPHGIDLGPLEPGVARRVQHADRYVHLAPAPLMAAWDELRGSLHEPRPEGELLLIGRREQRTNNSWMHNVPAMVAGSERCLLHVHPDDAAACGIADGEQVVMESRVHRGEVRVRVTDEMTPGVVSLPHGWGHAKAAPWQKVAGGTPGVSVNDWTDDELVEGVVGQSVLNGVPVRLYPRVAREQRVAS